MKLKAYIGGKLVHSIAVSRPEQLHNAFIDIQKLNPTHIYLSSTTGSSLIYNAKSQKPIRPNDFTRPSMPHKKFYTLPTAPEMYPIIAHFPDGSHTLIGLS